MSICLVTDSSCDLPPQLLSEHSIEVVPLTVRVSGKEYVEGVTISAAEFAQAMKNSPELPHTSQPNPQAFVQAFENAARKAGEKAEVLCITLSSKLSGTFQSAISAQKGFAGKAEVVDSLSGTLGLGLIVLEAKRLINAGHSLPDVCQLLHNFRDRMSVFVGVDTLENAVKGGRVNRIHAAMAQILRMKILLRVVEGSVGVCGKVRGHNNVLASFLDAMTAKGIEYHDRTIGISHVDNESDANELANAIKHRFSPREIIVVPMGSTIATYAGIGAIALAY